MYDDILVPTDGSPGIDAVIDHAASLARHHDATVHGLYVVDTAAYAGLPMEASFQEISQALRAEGETALDALDRVVEGVPVTTELSEGSPASEIVDYARNHDCDVIVMGTHGRSGVDRLLLWSVAERVVRASPVPVLTVHVSEEPPRTPTE